MKLNSLSRVFHINKGQFTLHSPQKPYRLSQLAQIDNDGVELTRCQRMPMPPAGTIAFRQPLRVKNEWLRTSQEMIVHREEKKAQ